MECIYDSEKVKKFTYINQKERFEHIEEMVAKGWFVMPFLYKDGKPYARFFRE